jgi:2-polyprenyl-3-methyl-5-hydroxy-6-metoxy-1,4-benzoquinol methylase
MESEKGRLEKIAKNSLYTTLCNTATIEYSFEVFRRFIIPGNILEMGPAEGLMTEKLYTLTDDLVLLEGSDDFCKHLVSKYPKTEVICSLFEDFEPTKDFNNIILGHVLEHVEDPVRILNLTKSWLTVNGRILATVPNSHSIHRQVAVLMGLLASEKSMSELDLHHGHRRIYDQKMLERDFTEAKLSIIASGGYWLKPLSNKQIHQNWNEQMLKAFMKIGESYPDIAGEIYIVATK